MSTLPLVIVSTTLLFPVAATSAAIVTYSGSGLIESDRQILDNTAFDNGRHFDFRLEIDARAPPTFENTIEAWYPNAATGEFMVDRLALSAGPARAVIVTTVNNDGAQTGFLDFSGQVEADGFSDSSDSNQRFRTARLVSR